MRTAAALAAAGLLALAACGADRPGPIETGPSFRDQNVPIGVTARYDESRFQGRWQVRAMLPEDEAIDSINFETRATGLQMQVAVFACDPAGICGTFGDTLRVRNEGKGMYLVQLPEGPQRRFWVLWVDEGFRTAVIGNPEGTFAWILDRAEKGGADRIRAAREILDFNGYDISQLKVNQ